MSTYNQSSRKIKISKKRLIRVRSLKGCPQRRGVCSKILILSPKKPNSADRKAAKIFLSNGKKIIAYIPGIGHTLLEHSSVLVRGGRVRDLPGMHYKLIRGKLDFSWKEFFGRRSQGRSKYGTPTVNGPKPRKKRKKHKKKVIKIKT